MKKAQMVRKAAYHNAFLWGIGNGLFSTALITYLIRDIYRGEPSVLISATIAWVIAAVYSTFSTLIFGLSTLLGGYAIPQSLERTSFLLTTIFLVIAAIFVLIIPGSLSRFSRER